MIKFIKPNWPAPSSIHAYTTTRFFDFKKNSDNFDQDVLQNRSALKSELNLSDEPIWLNQTHSTLVIEAIDKNRYQSADASFATFPNKISIVLTADCLPILICNKKATHVAAIHAGWRGLANGIVAAALTSLALPPSEIIVWLGPAISRKHFEVGEEVREIFLQNNPEANSAFSPSPAGRWMADLYELARIQLRQHGINQIFGGDHCTYSEENLFYSYRRDGEKAGRMATLIWIGNDRSSN